MIKLTTNANNSILTVDDHEFIISNELADFINETDSLNDETIEVTTSKTGVVTLKIKSLTYSINDKTKILSMYKTNSTTTNNNKGVIKMKTFIRFMKPKDESKKTNPFNNLVLRTVKPVLKDVEFDSLDAVKSAVYDALKPYMTENSTWEIEDNTKTQGLVVKNTFQKEGRPYPSHNIFFVNVVQVAE